MNKPRNPYNDLLVEARSTVRKLLHPRRTLLWWWGADKLQGTMLELKHKVEAGRALGYRAEVSARSDGGLQVDFVKDGSSEVPRRLYP